MVSTKLGQVQLGVAKVVLASLPEKRRNFLVCCPLVAFQTHDMISTLVDILFSDRPLAPHCVNGVRGTSNIEQLEKSCDSVDFVGFTLGRQLSDAEGR